MRKFKIQVKCVQEVILELPEEAYFMGVTKEQIMKMEEDNVRSDPTYFSFLEDSTEHVTVEVEEVK